ncbi:hypothetical protein PUN28_020645 [Cardiocondyla obscurior]|uniref:Uncharacterized protein n=1 Tax=Cardiocondyla obscurior TaxID=286306 RepID=A0AAW2E8H6_9HYME
MHTGQFRAFYFHQKPKHGQKTKKNIFEIWQRSIYPRYGQKTKKNVFKIWQRKFVRNLMEMLTCQSRAFYLHQKPKYGQDTKKKFGNLATPSYASHAEARGEHVFVLSNAL